MVHEASSGWSAFYRPKSMDGLGSTWTISSFKIFESDSNICLYKWHKRGNITSLLPPKYGWEDAVVKSESESMFDINLGSPFGVDSVDQAKSIEITYLIA